MRRDGAGTGSYRARAAFVAAVVVAAAAGVFPGAAPAASCTGYYSDATPPSTIRLWDNVYGTGRIYTIDFKLYVKQVLPREWMDGWPMESLQAGAMAVMTYSWYHAMHSAQTGDGRCYEIARSMQNWCDPRDIPENEPWRCSTSPRSNEAVDSVFAAARMTRRPAGGTGHIFEAFHRSGDSSDACGWWAGDPAPGHIMSQWGTVSCANDGLMWGATIRRYYFDNSEQPGHVTILDDAPASTHYYQVGDAWHEEVQALGRNGAVYENFYNFRTGRWSGWGSLTGTCTSAPATVGTELIGGLRYLYVLCRWTDGSIWEEHWNGLSWSPWRNLGGSTLSGPAVTMYRSGGAWQLHVYALGTDNAVWEQLYDFGSGQWWGWWTLHGTCTSAPAAAGTDSIGGYGRLYALCRGTDGAIWEKHWLGSSWSDWASLLGQWTSAPATTWYQSGADWQLHVYATGLDAAVWEKVYFLGSGQWWGWWTLHGAKTSAPAADSSSQCGLRVHARGRDDPVDSTWNRCAVWYLLYDGSSWDGWQNIEAPP